MIVVLLIFCASWLTLQPLSPMIVVTLHDQAASPISGAVITLTHSGRSIASGTTDADGRLVLPAPTVSDGTLRLDVRGMAPDGTPLTTEDGGVPVFVQASETTIPLRIDVGSLVIPDPFSLREIGTMDDGTVIPVVPRSGAGSPATPTVAVTVVQASPTSATQETSWERFALLLFGCACLVLVWVGVLRRGGRA